MTLRSIKNFIEEGVYFDEPEFAVFEASQGLDSTSGRLLVRYQQDKGPVELHLTRDQNLIGGTVGESIDEIRAAKSEHGIELLAERLQQTKQLLSVALKADMTDDAWAMLDCVEAECLRQLDGTLYAPGDRAYYDEKLQPFYRFEKPSR